jgi:cytochrome c5
MKSALFFLFTLCVALLFVSSKDISAGQEKDAGLLFERKCGTCHSIEKPKSKNKTKAEWEKTVMRMKNVNMAPISGKEARVIVDYLATSYGK